MKQREDGAHGIGLSVGTRRGLGCLVLLILLHGSSASAFRLIGAPNGWVRWDAAPRFIGGEDRSLDGGLRYSIETGSYAALRDQFMWVPSSGPTEEAFEAAIARAFEHWTIVDPTTALPAAFYFVADLSTPAVDVPGNPNDPNSFLGLNPGAEIDLFAETPHAGPGFAASVRFFVDTVAHDLTLTSGTPQYAGFAISGADIRINPGFVWSLSGFEVLLTHEIGHALGLADLEAATASGNVSAFLDDDYDAASSARAIATLSNSFALSIDPLDPDASPLRAFPADLNQDPGLDTPGVELLMESQGIFDLLGADPLLQNDEFAGRQFLYPVTVPEPGVAVMLVAGIVGLVSWAGHRRTRAPPSDSPARLGACESDAHKTPMDRECNPTGS